VSRDSWEYSICDRGIYYTTKAYHDDLDYHYVVDFTKPDVHKQFQNFLSTIEDNGKRKSMRDLKGQFRELKDLLT
jgi:hypothetical protein